MAPTSIARRGSVALGHLSLSWSFPTRLWLEGTTTMSYREEDVVMAAGHFPFSLVSRFVRESIGVSVRSVLLLPAESSSCA